MTYTNQSLAAIAKKHLGIPTLKRRHSDRLDFHDVAVWSVTAALQAAFDAGAASASIQPFNERNLLMTELENELLEALIDLLGDKPDIQNGQCIRCGRDYRAYPEDEGENCPSDDCPAYQAHIAVAKAKTASSQQNGTTHLPIVTVTIRGGLIEDLDATIPVHVIVADWDVPDEDTGKKPTRSVHTLAGELSGPKAEKLRRLIAHD